jgi:hypothetical protein
MLMRQAKEVSHHVEELNEILSKQPDIDAWVVAKMQDVTTQLSEITHYLDSRVGFRLGGDDIQKVQDSMLANGGQTLAANGARLKGGGVEDELIEYTIPTWALSSLINGDDSGLEDEDIEKLDSFINKVVKRHGNALFMLGDKSEKSEFSSYNDIDNLGNDVTTLYIKPSTKKFTEKAANGAKLKGAKTVSIIRDKDLGADYYSIVDYMTGDHIESVKGLRSAKQYVKNEDMNLQEQEEWEEEDNDNYYANGARLDNAQASIKDIERQLEKYQRLAADYMHSTRNPTYSPYDKDVDRLEKELQQKLKESDIYNFDTEDDFSARTLGKKSISKEIQMAQSWLPRIASPYRPRSYSYSKFVRSLITPMQKDVFEKLQKEYWQKAWNIKIKISPKKDTIEFEHYNKKKGNWYMEDGGEIAANGAKLKSGKLTLSKLKSMIEEYNAEGRNFELLGAYNQLELWGNDHRLETGSKEDIYRALIRYRYNPKYADGTELSNIDSMTDEEIITFANTFSYYDRMDEGIEEEFTDVEDAKEYLRMMAESE